MEYAVSAPARVRLSGSGLRVLWPVYAVYTLLACAMLAGLALVTHVLGARPAALLPGLAFAGAVLGFVVRGVARWRVRPALVVARSGLVLEHPDLARALVVPLGDIGYVVLSAQSPSALLGGARFPVAGDGGTELGRLWTGGRNASSLTFFETSHQPTVAVVFREPRDLPVRALSAMRVPFSRYPVEASRGLLLPVSELATLAAGLAAAGVPHGPALPAAHAAGLLVHPTR